MKELCEARLNLKMSSNVQIYPGKTDDIPPFKTASEQSELFEDLCHQWYPIWNSQLIRKYQCNGIYIETNAYMDTKVSFTPQSKLPVKRMNSSLIYVVNDTPFKMVNLLENTSAMADI